MDLLLEIERLNARLADLEQQLESVPRVAAIGVGEGSEALELDDTESVLDSESAGAGVGTAAMRVDAKPGVKLVGDPGDVTELVAGGNFVPTIEAVKDDADPVVRRGFRARRGAVDYGYLQYEYQHLAALAAGANVTKSGLILPLLSTGCLEGTASGLQVKIGDGLEIVDNELKTTGGGTIPAGIFAPYGGTTAPDGWLLCNGAAVSRATYSDLFTAIGTAFGVGDGSTTFNVPDTRRRRVMGLGTADSVGATEGEAVGDRLLAPAAPTIQKNGGGAPTTDTQSDSIMNHGASPDVAAGSDWPVVGNGSHTITGHSHEVTDIEASSPTAADHPYLLANWIIKT